MEKAFKGIRPAVVALIAAPVIKMGKSAKINKKTIIIPVITAVLVAFGKVTPVIIIIFLALGGILYMRHIGGRNDTFKTLCYIF